MVQLELVHHCLQFLYWQETENVLHTDFPGNNVGSGLFFMTKMMSDNERSFNRRALAAVGGLIDSIVPHMINVNQILSARVPIVGFRHQTTNIDCDLCIDNRYVYHVHFER
jgi:hypothetical protein